VPREDIDEEFLERMAVRLREYFREAAEELIAELESAAPR
jgi:hypothetical protein